MNGLILLLACSFAADPAWAHSGHVLDAHWNWDFWVVLPLAVAAGLYVQGVRNLWARAGRGRGIRISRALAFAAGWLLLAGAVVSPLHALGQQLLTAHMIEHEILMAAAAPLLAFSRPIGALLWALPQNLRLRLVAAARCRPVARSWHVLMAPFVATVLHGVAIWFWHAPPLFEAALVDPALHRLQHLSMLSSALLFWWALVRLPKYEYGLAAAQLFVTMIHTGLLGALITLSPRILYPLQTGHALLWGLRPIEDQQLAGLLMWVPAGIVYLGAALAMVAMWLARSSATAFRGGELAPR
jgi:cytochrome c oxidase assembly factor CtaG